MKRQRNMQQMRKHGLKKTNPQEKTNPKEIATQPVKRIQSSDSKEYPKFGK